jgi:Sulfotransferase domain
MFSELKFIFDYLLGKDIAGRNLQVYADDTFIVSYPRSGNTWTRFLIANLLHPQGPVNLLDLERLVPDTEGQSRQYFSVIPRPRVIKSHQYFDPRYKRVIYVVRDPRDVALSYYHFQRKYRFIRDELPLKTFVIASSPERLATLVPGRITPSAGLLHGTTVRDFSSNVTRI